jgi:hypothetical protein
MARFYCVVRACNVVGANYEVRFGPVGDPKSTTSTFTNGDAERGFFASSNLLGGFVGSQSHKGSRVAFRNIQIKKL